MKTMTCQQMGGPCDFSMQANTADEMMQQGEQHLNDMAAKGDEGHVQAKAMMDEAAQDPAKGAEWFAKFTSDFAALPEQA